MSSVDAAVAAIDAGQLVVIPTDTVYGLASSGPRGGGPRAVGAQTTLGRAADRARGNECRRARGADSGAARAACPRRPYTLVVSNPARRYPWLAGARPDTIGVRVPDLSGPAADLLARVGVVAATSANLHGGFDPRRVDDIPEVILDGSPSSTGRRARYAVDGAGSHRPRAARPARGAVSTADALARMAELHGE